MGKYETAVVIPVYNEERLIRRPLVWLDLSINPTDRKIPVVVVDNESNDNTVEKIESYKVLPNIEIHLLREPEKGTGSAADTGCRYAIEELGVDIMGRIDADVWPS